MGDKIKDIFALDGLFYKITENIADLVFLNIFFIIGCLPIITIGTSLTAMSHVNKLINDDNTKVNIFSQFINTYKSKLFSSIVNFVICIIVFVINLIYLLIFKDKDDLFSKIYFVFNLVVFIEFLSLSFYLYPLIAESEESNPFSYLQKSFLLANYNLLNTFAILGLTLILAIIIFSSASAVGWAIYFVIALGFSLLNFVIVRVVSRVFNKNGIGEVDE